ncbi:MAG: hypothetical protein QOG42_2535 [Solirubrobacteraceae bacterium]|jgi:hypothetical protein|nr:hypothetical protein [Solirubrobacteraceae bacterium]
MLNKRIAVPAIALGLSMLLGPSLSQAMPVSWVPGPDVVASLAQGWDLLTGLRHTPARPARRQGLWKNGAGIDPQGQPVPGAGSGATAPAAGDPGSGS